MRDHGLSVPPLSQVLRPIIYTSESYAPSIMTASRHTWSDEDSHGGKVSLNLGADQPNLRGGTRRRGIYATTIGVAQRV
jgi:hypothetical protein